MPAGTVKFFNAQKGFGFIQPDDGGPDVFMHVAGLAPNMPLPAENMRVTFELDTDRKSGKTKAANVRLAGNDAR